LLLLLSHVVGKQAHGVLHLRRRQLLLAFEEGLELALKLFIPKGLSLLSNLYIWVDLLSGRARSALLFLMDIDASEFLPFRVG